MARTLTAALLLTGSATLTNPVIAIDEDGRIVSIAEREDLGEGPSRDQTILTAAFFDIHIHGALNYDVMDATPSGFAHMAHFLATRGVAQFLPTTVTAPLDETLRALDRIATDIEARTHAGAVPVGIHLEGPFVSHEKRGVHPAAHILPPSVELFDRLQEAARGHILLLTLAPEVPGALELIRHAAALGVRISLGHSNATALETRAAVAAGARSATHIFNAMRALDHREPGILGVVLDEDALFAELICDGIHVAPELVRLWLKAKGAERAMLVTDGMSATGMPDGTYMLGGFAVEVAEGRCLANGVLAGSVLTMDRAVANFSRFTGASFGVATRLASINPARMLGLEEELALVPGRPANFNRYTPDGRLVETFLRGERVC